MNEEESVHDSEDAEAKEFLNLIRTDSKPEWLTILTDCVTTNDHFHALKLSSHFIMLPRFFKLLQECLVTQRWSEALKIMNVLNREPVNTTNTIWSAGMEILYTNPSGNIQLVGQLTNYLKLLHDVNGREVLLENVLYLLVQQHLDDAKKMIQKALALKRHGFKNSEKAKYTNTLLAAYQGLMFYTEWHMCKTKHEFQMQQNLEKPGISQVMSQVNYEEKMKILANKAESCFESVVKCSGVWDIFITKYIELLEYRNDEDKAHKVLLSYCERNEDNPNAHRYLYEFQSRHEIADMEKIKTLSLLAEKDPSNSLVLELCTLLKDSPDVIKYLFNMLDYPEWKDSLQPWEQLATFLQTLESVKHKLFLDVLHQCWDIRKDWWPEYMFNSDVTDTTDTHLLVHKAVVASVLLGKKNGFTKSVLKGVNKKEKKKLKKLISNINSSLEIT